MSNGNGTLTIEDVRDQQRLTKVIHVRKLDVGYTLMMVEEDLAGNAVSVRRIATQSLNEARRYMDAWLLATVPQQPCPETEEVN